jgi:dihydrofolate reductase
MISLSAVVAVSENGVIGREGGLPWRISEDLKEFKRITMGHPIVMGRKTFESIGRPLPGRRNLVLTREKNWRHEGVECFQSWQDLRNALSPSDGGEAEVMLIGGAQIYKLLWPEVKRLYLTLVHAKIEGDTQLEYFDRIPKDFKEISREKRSQTEPTALEYSFIVLERIVSANAS